MAAARRTPDEVTARLAGARPQDGDSRHRGRQPGSCATARLTASPASRSAPANSPAISHPVRLWRHAREVRRIFDTPRALVAGHRGVRAKRTSATRPWCPSRCRCEDRSRRYACFDAPFERRKHLEAARRRPAGAVSHSRHGIEPCKRAGGEHERTAQDGAGFRPRRCSRGALSRARQAGGQEMS